MRAKAKDGPLFQPSNSERGYVGREVSLHVHMMQLLAFIRGPMPKYGSEWLWNKEWQPFIKESLALWLAMSFNEL